MSDPEFDELKREFLQEAEQKVREIRDAFAAQNPPTPETVERAIYLAHQLKGAGGSYGFQPISTDAAALERALEKIAGGEAEAVNEVNSQLNSLLGIIEKQSRDLAVSHPA